MSTRCTFVVSISPIELQVASFGFRSLMNSTTKLRFKSSWTGFEYEAHSGIGVRVQWRAV